MIRKLLVALIVISSLATIGLGYKKFIVDQNPVVADKPEDSEQPKPEPKSEPQPEPKPEPAPPTFDDALASISQAELQEIVVYLASDELEGRMSGREGNVKAAEYIKKYLENIGLETMYHEFQIRGGSSKNIYCWMNGTTDDIVVVGAHMDGIGMGGIYSRTPNSKSIHPGADDNASGTAAVMVMAKALSRIKGQNKRTLVFQLYSGEEIGLVGSKAYCADPKFPVSKPSMSNHVAMLNLDMIGHLGKGVYSVGESLDSSIDLKSIVSGLSGNYDFADQICGFGAKGGGSDHIPFYNKGVPVVFLHTGLHGNYHTPGDKPDTLNFEGVEKVTRFATELAWKVSQFGDKIEFNYAKFVELPATHDHGVAEVPFPQEN